MSKKTLLLKGMKGTFLSGAMLASMGLSHPVFAMTTVRPVAMTRTKENTVAYVYGAVESVGTGSFAVKRNADGKLITVTITDTTKIVRRFGAKSSLAEMAVTDITEVKGTWIDANKTQLTATFVRNNSVQARHGTFAGTVKDATGSNFSLQSKERGIQTVMPDSSTKYVNSRGKRSQPASLQVGHTVRATGVWDKQLNTIKEVKLIKDQSLK